MDAKDLVRAMIADLAINGGTSAFDLLAHAVSVAHDLDWDDAKEWLAEEVQERIVAVAD